MFHSVGTVRRTKADNPFAPSVRSIGCKPMADWTTIASFATAGGTLVLAVATFFGGALVEPHSPHRRRVAPHRHAPTAHPVAI